MAYGDAREGKWRGNWRMEWVVSTLHITSEHGVSSITTITAADAHTSAASSRLNWIELAPPRWFKWTRPFRRETKSSFCVCAITFQTQPTSCMNHIFPYASTHFQLAHGNIRRCGLLKISVYSASLSWINYFQPVPAVVFVTWLLLFHLFPALYLYISTPSWTICLHSF